ncbi:hypothetical protein [Leifsonia sp. fls2-241-R2A-40a]|uniref:hypothetical protein n=1 Tax=Leifsonia sp. fls2-241-R2A-40a TaxID=3040290 RepID=UPI00254CCFDA|nr:hypothetical protein [Leifsonia sp. fls2-241-R2A-40a]
MEELDVAIEDGSEAGVELAWLTSWAAIPYDLAGVLQRLPRRPFAGGWILPGQAVRATPDLTWKLNAVKRLERELPSSVALLWIDDNLRAMRALDPSWAADRSRDRLLLAPPPTTGLLPGHLRQIREFKRRTRTRPDSV